MANQVFNRYEKKYIISTEVYHRIIPLLEDYMEVDEHSRNGVFYSICNIYYDTSDNEIIRKSIDKPIYKEKLRLRSYGVVTLKDKVYIEIKKKFDGCINKRRVAMTHEEALRFLKTQQKPQTPTGLNEQIINEIDFLIHRYSSLQPALYLSYDRNALFGKENPNFRVTFDTNLLTRRYDLRLDYGIYGEELLPKGQWIMEAKSDYTFPLWFAELLSKYKIYPISFSKYGSEYRKYLQSYETGKQMII